MIELTRQNWEQVEKLFERASALDGAEREAYLDAACEGQRELREYVLSLLRADADVDATVNRTIAETMTRVFDETEASADLAGERIGPYRVERLLGAGGMGRVYLATRDDEQFEQQVAIKLGRHRLVDPDTVARLRAERQILADLDHPGIARLFDGGQTDDGVPYLVMEYIDGARIDAYCDIHRLDIDARLDLFRRICAAVQYAHQNLVIHRDIKASNILVTGDGTPKLLDFGIAKLTDAAGAATDGLTREGAVILTPANATPEQLQGRAVTTAADVYALGLLLNVLLCGYRAFDADSKTPSEFARQVVHSPALRPSVQLERAHKLKPHDRAAAGELASILHNRNTQFGRLQRRLRGDLDTIVLNALRKEPERRYASVGALADDIALHQRGMPISARADSFRYRAGKFVRRHTLAVATGALVVGLLAAFAVTVSVQNQRIAAERDTAREVSDFLENIFLSQDPAEARGASITADELLAAGASRIRDNLDQRPEIQSTLMATIGRVYNNLGEFRESAELLEQALALRLELYGEQHAAVAAAQADLAQTLTHLAQYSRAQALLEQALATNRATGETAQPELASNLSNLANLYLRNGDTARARKAAVESVELYAGLGPDYAHNLASAKATLARIMQVTGNLAETERLLQDAIATLAAAEGNDHPSMAYYLQNLGVLQRSKGDLEAAANTLSRAVTATQRILGDKHDLLAASLVDQGIVYHRMGNFASADAAMQRALDLYRETRGADNPAVGYTLVVRGMLQHDMAEPALAEASLREALRIFAANFDGEHQYIASALTELGAVLNTTGRPVEALPLLQRAVEIRLQDYTDGDELLAATQTEYADALLRLGRVDEAEPILRASYRALQDKPGRRRQRAARTLGRFHELSDDDRAGATPSPE